MFIPPAALIVLASLLQGDARPSPCTATEYRQFDFWIGEWEVRTPDGTIAGTNSIIRELGGCVLHERWSGARGMKGESFNTWDAARRGWHQTWVDTAGTLLLLDGGLDERGRMVLAGEGRARDGSPVRHRITWEPTGAVVRQLWESSSDAGQTWTVVFDGRYARRKD